MGKTITDQDKIDVVNYYQSFPMSVGSCAKHFNFCVPTISKILDECNIERYNRAQVYSPYLKEDFFRNIDGFQAEFKAYFLGLLITDGNVFVPKNKPGAQKTISITLQEEDQYILEQFIEVLNSNDIVSHDGRGCAQAFIRSNIMADDLARYGVTPNKTLYTRLPIFQNKTIMSWLFRGILEGDGSIGYGPTSFNKYYHAISFCGSREFMNDIQNYLHEALGLPSKTVYSYSDRHLSEIKYRNLWEIQRLGNWIYEYPMNICMYRKYNKFLDLKQFFGLY